MLETRRKWGRERGEQIRRAEEEGEKRISSVRERGRRGTQMSKAREGRKRRGTHFSLAAGGSFSSYFFALLMRKEGRSEKVLSFLFFFYYSWEERGDEGDCQTQQGWTGGKNIVPFLPMACCRCRFFPFNALRKREFNTIAACTHGIRNTFPPSLYRTMRTEN